MSRRLRQLAAYAARMTEEGRFGEIEALIVQVAFGEYLSQLSGGIPMSQGEIVRPQDLGISRHRQCSLPHRRCPRPDRTGQHREVRARLAKLIAENVGAASFGDAGLEDTYEAIREQMRRFADAEVVPYAHDWHLKDEYIPLEVIAKMAELGVFGLTIPEEFGGLGLGKESMCVVSEELLARLYRRRLARHALRDRGRTDPRRRHARAEGEVAAEDRERRNPAHRRLHRAQYRLRPREPQDARPT